jgi:hypothetical protein
MHLSGAAVKATKENVLDLAAAHRGPKECDTVWAKKLLSEQQQQ